MKIRDQRSAELYKRCLAAKQLESYSKLCEIMEDFNQLKMAEEKELSRKASFDSVIFEENNASKKPEKRPNVIDVLLQKYLPIAAKGDTEFLLEEEFEQILDNLEHKEFKDEIIDSFKDYSSNSKKYNYFESADKSFSHCIGKNKKGQFVISKADLKEYQDAVKNGEFSLYMKKFDSEFRAHSRTYLGHEHYKIATKALANIALTQPEMTDSKSFSKITPETYDASIRGFYRSRSQDKAYKTLSEYENEEPGKFKESLYTHTLGRKFTGNKHSIKKTIAVVLAAGTIVGAAIPAIEYANEFNSVTIENAESKGYDLHISPTTLLQLKETRKTLDELKKATDFPEIDQLIDLNNTIDNNMNLIINDLVIQAVHESEPDWKVNKVETRYDDRMAKNGDPSNRITIEYVDEDKNTQTTVVTNFSNPNILHGIAQAFDNKDTSLEDTFKGEREYDNQFNELLEDYKKANNVASKSESYNALLDYYTVHIDAQEIVAAKGMEFKNGFFSDRLTLNLSNKKEVQEAAKSSEKTEVSRDDDDAR